MSEPITDLHKLKFAMYVANGWKSKLPEGE